VPILPLGAAILFFRTAGARHDEIPAVSEPADSGDDWRPKPGRLDGRENRRFVERRGFRGRVAVELQGAVAEGEDLRLLAASQAFADRGLWREVPRHRPVGSPGQEPPRARDHQPRRFGASSVFSAG
jgi:hypothetical protein